MGLGICERLSAKVKVLLDVVVQMGLGICERLFAKSRY